MQRLSTLAIFLIAAHALSGCADEKDAVAAENGGPPAVTASVPGPARAPIGGRPLLMEAPATDFTNAAPEDASRQASAMFDGAAMHHVPLSDVSAWGRPSAPPTPTRVCHWWTTWRA